MYKNDLQGEWGMTHPIYTAHKLFHLRSAKRRRAASKYRAALSSYEGINPRFDFYSFEGYLAGRLVIEIVKRTYPVTRTEFMNAVYATRLYEIDGLMLGPYSDDCKLDRRKSPFEGRSSIVPLQSGVAIHQCV